LIRPATVADMWALRRKPRRRIYFYNDALLASTYHPYVQTLRALVAPISSRSDRLTLVLRDRGLHGFIQAHRRSAAPEIELQYLAAFGRRQPRMSDGDVFYQLIEASLQRVAQHQMQRVFATVGHRSADVIEVLRQLGFQPYTQQSIWMLAEPGVEAGSSMVALRRQARKDAWALHQLYLSLTPRVVQQAELRESTSWEWSHRRGWTQLRERGWVLGDDKELTVHLHLRTGSRGHVLRPMFAPHLGPDAAAMMRYMLTQIHEQRPVFAVVRAYESHLRGTLEELGFVERGEQTLFVKQLALMQRQSLFAPALRPIEHAEGAMAIAVQRTHIH
jgi:hypothetical protein